MAVTRSKTREVADGVTSGRVTRARSGPTPLNNSPAGSGVTQPLQTRRIPRYTNPYQIRQPPQIQARTTTQAPVASGPAQNRYPTLDTRIGPETAAHYEEVVQKAISQLEEATTREEKLFALGRRLRERANTLPSGRLAERQISESIIVQVNGVDCVECRMPTQMSY
ncbi:hypothetical protein FALBO_5118 [Fusarium albosuccineum]|uniref:Uncharacterized protein n=1 Tax=Fusarium albosuccineum TaxID=1237068 RepID=A0A8H4LHZ9_9HYPO|nr:hypothetical protein FALBO_5118 [Fusarium albosuccineum]